MTPTEATDSTVVARSPGKLILAGEHAVVYGRPALVCAISVYARCKVELLTENRVRLAAPDLGYWGELPVERLEDLYEDISERKERFDKGQLETRQLMRGPEELPWYAASLAWRAAGRPQVGWSMEVISEIPQDSGCGSSAAISSAIISAVSNRLGCELTRQKQFDLVLEAEKLRHGRPSGVDPAAVVYGGVLRYQQRRWTRLGVAPGKLCLVHTGRPLSGTGECVAAVREKWEHAAIWQEFEEVVGCLERALACGDSEAVRNAVRANHRLLCRVGVVPQRVQDFVGAIEARGGAAKICGAGAVRGEAAGVVWIVDGEDVEELAEAYGYSVMVVSTDEQGVTIG